MMKRAMSKYSLTGGCLFWRVPYVQMNLKENKHMNKKRTNPEFIRFSSQFLPMNLLKKQYG